MRHLLAHVAIILVAITSLADAASVSVAAKLSHRVADVGSEVRLQIEVSGASSDVSPPDISVDGLDIQYAGPSNSTQIQIINGQITRDVRSTLSYQVVPQREGEFTIPALTVQVDGRNYRTQPIGLKVQKGSASAGGQAADDQARAFAEIEIKKPTAYVGQVLPVEVRLFVDSRVRVEDVTNMPDLTGDGFTMQKFPRFDQERETRNGHEYLVLVFRTAMTPTKAGKLSIGPCEIPFVAQTPRPRRNRGRSLFDSLFGDDPFDPFGAFAERKRYVAKAPAIELQVKPLPAEGKPQSFSGAVGQFRFEAHGSPAQVKIGEPVTMRLRVTGEGNFDRMEAPKLIAPSGWQAYDASASFDATNELKTAGTKTFEMPVVPVMKHEQMPQFEFSYFDPEVGKYASLRSKPGPLVVQGEPLSAATPAPMPAPAATPEPSQPAVAKSPIDISGLHYDEGPRGTFAPIYERRGFWVANGIAALSALTLIGSRFFRREPARIRASALRRQRDQFWRRLRDERGSGEFYDYAAKLVQIETAIRGGVEPSSVDAAAARRVCHLDDERATDIESIFDARSERLYAGAAALDAPISAREREKVIAALEKFCRA